MGFPRLLLYAATGRDDLLACAGAHLEPAHRHRLLDRAVRQHLHRTLGRPNQPRRGQRLARDLTIQRLEIVEPYDLRFLAERIGEPTLRQTPRDRHLATLEMWLAAARTVMARARLDALGALARRFSGSRSRTAAKPLAVARRTWRGRQVVQADLFDLLHRGLCFLRHL